MFHKVLIKLGNTLLVSARKLRGAWLDWYANQGVPVPAPARAFQVGWVLWCLLGAICVLNLWAVEDVVWINARGTVAGEDSCRYCFRPVNLSGGYVGDFRSNHWRQTFPGFIQ
jgi:hypothetical protein